MEEEILEVEKKNWFKDKKDKFLEFCHNHPDIMLTVVGGVFTLAGACVNYATTVNEYKDSVYMTDGDDVYKLPASKMNTKKIKTVK